MLPVPVRNACIYLDSPDSPFFGGHWSLHSQRAVLCRAPMARPSMHEFSWKQFWFPAKTSSTAGARSSRQDFCSL